MKHTLKQRAEHLWASASRPELRHSMHYQCGLYKSSADRTPIVSAHLDHSCALSLIRLIAMLVGIALIVTALRPMMCRLKKRMCRIKCDT